jgi:hypothetical protein
MQASSLHAATVEKINSDGTLFLVKPEIDEQFSNKDLCYIISNEKLIGNGFVNIEENGKVLVKPTAPISNIKVGDVISLSHDPVWVQNNLKVSSITGQITKVKETNQSIFVALEPQFLPLFQLGKETKIQSDATLDEVTAVVSDYRKSGIWFKIDTKFDIFAAGKKVSFTGFNFAPSNTTPYEKKKSIFFISKLGPVLQNYRFKDNSSDPVSYWGISSSFLLMKSIGSSKNWMPIAGGLSFESTRRDVEGTASNISGFSLTAESGIQNKLTDQLNFGVLFGYDYGIKYDLTAITAGSTYKGKIQHSNYSYGLQSLFTNPKDRLIAGLEVSYSSGQGKLINDEEGERIEFKYNYKGYRQRLILGTQF